MDSAVSIGSCYVNDELLWTTDYILLNFGLHVLALHDDRKIQWKFTIETTLWNGQNVIFIPSSSCV